MVKLQTFFHVHPEKPKGRFLGTQFDCFVRKKIIHWLKPQPPTRENIDSSWTSQYLPDFKSYLGSTNQGAVGGCGVGRWAGLDTEGANQDTTFCVFFWFKTLFCRCFLFEMLIVQCFLLTPCNKNTGVLAASCNNTQHQNTKT